MSGVNSPGLDEHLYHQNQTRKSCEICKKQAAAGLPPLLGVRLIFLPIKATRALGLGDTMTSVQDEFIAVAPVLLCLRLMWDSS